MKYELPRPGADQGLGRRERGRRRRRRLTRNEAAVIARHERHCYREVSSGRRLSATRPDSTDRPRPAHTTPLTNTPRSPGPGRAVEAVQKETWGN